MIIAIIPVSGRKDIIQFTLPRLLKQVDKVIVAGDTTDDFISGCDFYLCDKGMALGAKWQFCLERAKEYNPDVVLISASGGVFRDDYFNVEFKDVCGSKGLHYLDIQPGSKRAIYWPGYRGNRESEPIGLGRMFTASFIDRCKWRLFDIKSNSGIDFRTMEIIKVNEGEIEINPSIPMRISSYKYSQKDPYDRLLRTNIIIDKTITEICDYYDLNSTHLL